jgi:hypothetical protein
MASEPLTLNTRVLKAVYFSEVGFLDAELASLVYPSRNWRAIIDGKEVLQQGLIRRIGRGST